jgi:hypothetical protein
MVMDGIGSAGKLYQICMYNAVSLANKGSCRASQTKILRESFMGGTTPLSSGHKKLVVPAAVRQLQLDSCTCLQMKVAR